MRGVGCIHCGGHRSAGAYYCIRCWASGSTRRQRIKRAFDRARLDGHGSAAQRISRNLIGLR